MKASLFRVRLTKGAIAFLLIAFTHVSLAQMKENGVGPGASVVFGKEETGINLRFHYFPNHKSCFGIETNIFPKEGHDLTENMEITLNGHLIFELSEHIGVYPLAGVGWKNLHDESGFRALMGGGFHGKYGRFAPYTEYIYGAGFESEGIFIVGTFYTIPFE